VATPNPYQSPNSPLRDVADAGSVLRGVLAGAGVLIAGWMLVAAIGWVFVAMVFGAGSLEGRAWILPYYALAMFVLNVAIDFAAGYCAARFSNRASYVAPAIVVALSLVIGIGFLVLGLRASVAAMGIAPTLLMIGQKLVGVVALFAGAWFAITKMK
jgi:hypothetical protein